MKRQIVHLLVLTTLAGAIGAGCHTRHVVVVREPATVVAPTGQVIVSQPPPEPRHEVIGVAPSSAHVWVQGYWTYRNGRWAWLPGHWEARPTAAATWVPGYWDHTVSGYVWRPGHWD